MEVTYLHSQLSWAVVEVGNNVVLSSRLYNNNIDYNKKSTINKEEEVNFLRSLESTCTIAHNNDEMIIIEIIIRLVVVFFDPAGFPSKQNKIRLENKRRATKSEVRTPKQNLSQNSRNTVYLGLCVNVLSVWTIPMLHVAPR